MTMMYDQSGSSSDEQSTRMLKRKADFDGKPSKKSKHTRASKAKWTPEEDEVLTRAVLMSGEGNWKKIAQSLHDRSHLQCLHRWQKVLNPALVKGPWKEEEDAKLGELVEKYGPKDWSTIAGHIPGRIGKQCRERWFNHLSPDVRKTNWTPEEDKIIIDAHSKVGNKWTNISKLLDGRPANAIKNHWNSTLLKRIQDSNGEPTPRRDRNRTKKPPPLRATEFDFRSQMLQQQFDESSDSSPQHYSQSPVSSPDSYHQETPLTNTVRFHIPDAPHVFFANPFNTEMQHHPAAITTIPSTVWDSWPAPNIIHLTHPPAALPVPNHNLNFGHLAGANNITHHLTTATPLATNFAYINTNINHNNINNNMNNVNTMNNMNNMNNNMNNNVNMNNHIISNNIQTNAVNTMNNSYDTDSYSGLSLSESSSPEDFIDAYSSSSQSSSPFPTELQYCFDPQANAEMVQSMPIDTSCMMSSGMNGSMGISNLGLLGLENLTAFPLEL